MDKETPYFCLICDKELESDHDLAMDAGFVTINFHYGSKFDQCIGMPTKGIYKHTIDKNDPKKKLKEMLNCKKIEGVVCDECFVKKLDYFQGYAEYKDRDPVIKRQ